MDSKSLIASRVAQELKSGDLVNLGIGLPTMVANYLPTGVEVFFQSENGILGMSSLPDSKLQDEDLTDAGGSPIGAIPGAVGFDSCFSFGLIRGGHLDVTVLGGLQVDEKGQLANWMVPGKMVPGMGGAMDLVAGGKTRNRGHDPYSQGQSENHEGMQPASDGAAASRPDCNGSGSHRTDGCRSGVARTCSRRQR